MSTSLKVVRWADSGLACTSRRAMVFRILVRGRAGDALAWLPVRRRQQPYRRKRGAAVDAGATVVTGGGGGSGVRRRWSPGRGADLRVAPPRCPRARAPPRRRGRDELADRTSAPRGRERISRGPSAGEGIGMLAFSLSNSKSSSPFWTKSPFFLSHRGDASACAIDSPTRGNLELVLHAPFRTSHGAPISPRSGQLSACSAACLACEPVAGLALAFLPT